MTHQLPSNPSLVQLKKQAKDILKAHKSGDASCCEALRLHHRFNGKTDKNILLSKVGLREVQHALALDYGFKGWAELKKHILGRTGDGTLLHIHCGDSSAGALRNSSVSGDVFVWREIYIEGPAPGNVSDDEFNRVRAEFLGSMGVDTSAVLQGAQSRKDKVVSEAGKYEEVVLWFDACMFDQTIMIRLIDLCSRQKWPNTKLSLICIGNKGLGELHPEEYPPLFKTRHEVSSAEIELAGKAWKAFTSDNPQNIERLLDGDCTALPYLRDALVRHLEQYPSVRNGLNRLENQVLKAVDSGERKLGKIFVEVSNMEDQPFFGDTSLWGVINGLGTCRVPLLDVTGPGSLSELTKVDPENYQPVSGKKLRQWDISITDTGRDVIAGKQDAVKLNGIDRWLGGIHLQGAEAQWRWDEQNGQLVAFEVVRARMSDVIARQLQELPICEANARNPEKDRTGACSGLLSGEYRWHAAHEYDANRNIGGFRRYLSRSANIAADLLRRTDANEPISFPMTDAYMSILDAWAVADFNLARQIAGLMGCCRGECLNDTMFDRIFGHTLRHLALGQMQDAEEWNNKLLDLCRPQEHWNKRGYPLLISAFLSHRPELIPEALAAVIDGHRASQKDAGNRTEFALLCFWGLGLVNFGRHIGFDIEFDDPWIPKELQ